MEKKKKRSNKPDSVEEVIIHDSDKTSNISKTTYKPNSNSDEKKKESNNERENNSLNQELLNQKNKQIENRNQQRERILDKEIYENKVDYVESKNPKKKIAPLNKENSQSKTSSVKSEKKQDQSKQKEKITNPSKEPMNEEKNHICISAEQAHAVLSESGVFERVGDEYLLRDDWGVVVNVKVGKEGVDFIYFDGSTYYAAKDSTFNEILDLVDGDEEEAELYWQHLQQIIIINEIAVKSAADAVYGIGTKYADALYKEILQTGKTIGVYFKEF